MPATKKFVLADVAKETRDKYPDVEIDLGDENPITFPPPQLWGQEITSLGSDNDGVLKTLLGVDGYDRFFAAGGTLGMFQEIIEQLSGVELGESSAS